MFTHLSVSHYKSISSAELKLSNIMLLVGPNSAGKSNLIDSLRLLHDAVASDLDTAVSSRYGIASIRERTPQKTYDVKIAFDFVHGKVTGNYSVVLATTSGAGYAVKSEAGSWRGRAAVPVKIAKLKFNVTETDSEISFTRKKDGAISVTIKNLETEKEHVAQGKMTSNSELFLRDARYADFPFDKPSNYFPMMAPLFEPLKSQVANFQHYAIFPNDLRQPQKPIGEKRLSSNGDNLATVWRDLSTTSRRNVKAEILGAMKRVEPALSNITVRSVSGFLTLNFEFKDEKGRAFTFNVSQISDGTLRLLGILTALYHPNAPRCISIEEPEQNIHPGALQVLADAVKDVARRRQVLFTSHSPEFLDQFEPENIVVIEKTNAQSKCGNMKSYQMKLVRDGLFRVGELMKTEGLRTE